MLRWLDRLRGMDQSLGKRGERFAARWLKRRGYRIIARNLTLGDDEADIVAESPDGKVIAVVEVKTRADDLIAPEDQVGAVKQLRLSRIAARMLRDGRFRERALRFDVIAIVWPEGAEPRVRHYEGAFDSRI